MISAPSLGVYYCQQLTLSVCPSVTKHQIASSFFLFFDGIEPFWGSQFSVNPSTKRCSSIFDSGPLTPRPPIAQNLLPKICTKSPITRLVRQIDRRRLGLTAGYGGWPIQWNRAKCCGTDRCCHDDEIWARRGDPVAYRLVIIIIIIITIIIFIIIIFSFYLFYLYF